MNATAIGDSRYDDRLDESTSPGFREKVFGIERAFLDRARRIDAAQLSPSSRITYEIFTTEREHALAGQKFHEEYMPLNQMAGLPMDLAVYGSGTGPQPFKTADDYRRFLARMKQFPRWVDGAITQMRTGMTRGITLPRPAVAKVVPQLRGIVTPTPEAMPLRRTFSRATRVAMGSISVASTATGASLRAAIARTPLPVPRSSTRLTLRARITSKITSRQPAVVPW